MATTRNKYDKAFKLMAVELSHQRTDLNALAKELNIRAELLYRWRNELATKQETSFPGNGKVLQTDLQAENSRLKKHIKDIELERDILKKAVGIFSKSDGKYFNS